MTHGTSGGLQHQPEPLLSQYLPIVPRPLIAQRRALAPLLQPWMLSGPCGQATPLAHTQLTSPGTTGKKPSLENCGNSLAWGSAWGTELFSQSAGMSQRLFASLQGAVTKGRCGQRGGVPAKGRHCLCWEAGRAGWHIPLRPSGSQKDLRSPTASPGMSITHRGAAHSGELSKRVPCCCLPRAWACRWPDPANNHTDAAGGYECSLHLR